MFSPETSLPQPSHDQRFTLLHVSYAHEVGVSSEPEISVATVDLQRPNGGHFLLLASDGVFEVFSNDAAGEKLVDFLSQGLSLQESCDKLATEAAKLWAKQSPNYCDDITVMVYAL